MRFLSFEGPLLLPNYLLWCTKNHAPSSVVWSPLCIARCFGYCKLCCIGDWFLSITLVPSLRWLCRQGQRIGPGVTPIIVRLLWILGIRKIIVYPSPLVVTSHSCEIMNAARFPSRLLLWFVRCELERRWRIKDGLWRTSLDKPWPREAHLTPQAQTDAMNIFLCLIISYQTICNNKKLVVVVLSSKSSFLAYQAAWPFFCLIL